MPTWRGHFQEMTAADNSKKLTTEKKEECVEITTSAEVIEEAIAKSEIIKSSWNSQNYTSSKKRKYPRTGTPVLSYQCIKKNSGRTF